MRVALRMSLRRRLRCLLRRVQLRRGFPGRVVAWRSLAIACLVVFLFQGNAAVAARNRVVPISWEKFPRGLPADADAERIRLILLNANRYALTTWWKARGFGVQKEPILDFFGRGETNIRPVANEAFALAVALATGAYDAQRVGVPRDIAIERTVRLVTSLARRHRATTKKGWGNSWQTASWATSSGFAAWLFWDRLTPQAQKEVQVMVEFESNRLNALGVPSYRSATGTIIYKGDSKAEENAWNAMILQLAIAMMPHHANRDIWRTKMLQYMLSAFSRPQDVGSDRVVHGRALSEWLTGSNINEDGSVVNHGRIHPDYMAAITSNIHAALTHTLAGFPTPRAAFFNADVVYRGLVDQSHKGKTIYEPGVATIWYPQGTRWGSKRRMNFALLDIEARAFGFDRKASVKAGEWERLHAQAVLEMQRRAKDGRTYQDPEEDRYQGREEWVADLAAQAYLTKWIKRQGGFSVTDDAFPFKIVNRR